MKSAYCPRSLLRCFLSSGTRSAHRYAGQTISFVHYLDDSACSRYGVRLNFPRDCLITQRSPDIAKFYNYRVLIVATILLLDSLIGEPTVPSAA